MTDATPEERNIAQVFQFPVIYDTMTVYDNLAFPLRNRGVAEAEVEPASARSPRCSSSTRRSSKRASGLTADGKQKISLGRGLVRSDVNVIMFDEPLTVIDPHLKWVLRSKLKELHHRIRRTMIYVTHDQTEALTFADQVVVMKDGEIVQIGTPVELFERPQHTFVGHFIGSPGMNVLPCEVQGRQGDRSPASRSRPANARGLSRQRQARSSSASGRNSSASPARAFRSTIVKVLDAGRYRIVETRRAGDSAIKLLVPEGDADPGGQGASPLRSGAHAGLRRRLDGDLRAAR